MQKHIITWEKWIDPYGGDFGHLGPVEQLDEFNARSLKDDTAYDPFAESEDDDLDSKTIPESYKKVITQLGLVPMTEYS